MAPATTPTTPAAEPANAKPVGFAPESDVLEESEVDAALFESLVADAALTWIPYDDTARGGGSLASAPSGPGSVGGPACRGPTCSMSAMPIPSFAVCRSLTRPSTTGTPLATPPVRPRTPGPIPRTRARPGSPSIMVPAPKRSPHGAPVVMVLQELATLLSAAGSGRTRRPRSSRMRSRIVGSRLVAVAALPVAGGSLGTGGGEAGEEGGGGDGALHCGWYCVYTKLVEEDGKCRSSNDNGDNSPNDIYLIPRNADMLTSQAESQKRGMSGTARFVSMLSPTNTVFAFARHHQVCSHAGQRDHHGDLTRKVERLLEPSHPIEPRSPGDGISTTSSSTPFGFHSPGSTSSIVN
ncbi:hypothetical protein KC346_g47 [Hortaea werneckii]|nr:hypothetical protein KC346_g47 [Hortaea werneckii]